jgi:hypothetical protein
MKAIKGIPIWALILILLLLANLGWMSWNLYQHAEYDAIRAAYKHFKIEVLHTNNLSCIGLFEAKTEQPIWAEFSRGGKLEMESYFFQGKEIFDVALSGNRPPRYGVFFCGPEKRVTWWLDRGGIGSFTERIFYDTNCDVSKHEIWYNQGWQSVDRRNETNGIVLNGQWLRLKLDTNGAWTINSTSNQPSQ